MGVVEIATLVGLFFVKVVLPAIGAGAVTAAAIPDRPRRGGLAARRASRAVNALGFNFGHATNQR